MKLIVSRINGLRNIPVRFTLKRPLFWMFSQSVVLTSLLAALSMLAELVNPVNWLLQNHVPIVKTFYVRFTLKRAYIQRQLEWKSWNCKI